MSATFLLVLAGTLLGFSTAAEARLTAVTTIGGAYADEDTALALRNLASSRQLQPPYSSPNLQAQLLDAVNSQRTANGVRKLCWNKKLQNAAQAHSNDMAAKKFMGHTGSDNSNMSQRITRAGYKPAVCGENVAQGQTTVDEVMKAWMDSPKHRKNILESSYTMFGCATYKSSWTQDFAASKTEQCSISGGYNSYGR